MSDSILSAILWIVWFVFLLVINSCGLRSTWSNYQYERKFGIRAGGKIALIVMTIVAILCCVAGIGIWGYRIYEEVSKPEEVTAPAPEQHVEATADTLNIQDYLDQ